MPAADETYQEQGLQHQLSAGQMAMVAVGGSIGTGLLLGSAAALEIAGPGVLLSFALAAFINWTVAIAVFIMIGSGLLLSGHVAPQYTAQGGFLPKGPLAPLLAMGFALYTFAGIEFVAITTGETRSVKEIPRAIRLTFAILTVVYLGAIVVLVGVMPWNRAGVAESPFVSVFRHAGIPAAPHIMTFVVLTAALSGANAALYVSSRTLFSLARPGWAPAAFGRLNAAGSPMLALLASSYGIVVALVLEKRSEEHTS